MSRLIVVGGFLGSGKTTLMSQAAKNLQTQGYRIGLITNDQGDDLVDTSLLKQQGFGVAEVAGGCFCCRFPDLLAALGKLKAITKPDIILAEPVGSCTDLAATVLRPLSRYYTELQLAPLSVVFDPLRDTSNFNSQVRYLFEQQLSEAQVIVVNKTDLLSEDKKLEAHELLRTRYPQAKVLNLSALTGDGLEVWLDSVLGVSNSEVNVLDLDYQRYAEAEAALGWLNAKGIVASNEAFSPVKWAENTFKSLSKTFEEAASPIAHIKMQFAVDSPKGLSPLFYKASLTGHEASINWDSVPESSSATRLEFTLNARVNTSPHRLEQAVVYALEFTRPNSGARFYFTDFDCFQPAPPKPTYRFVEVNE